MEWTGMLVVSLKFPILVSLTVLRAKCHYPWPSHDVIGSHVCVQPRSQGQDRGPWERGWLVYWNLAVLLC